MSPSVEHQMLKQAAEAFGSQAELGGQDFSQFDVSDGQHYGTVMEVGTRITSGGYFQAYIRFVIDSGNDRDKTPQATFSLPTPDEAEQIAKDLQSTNEERKAAAEQKCVGLRMLRDAYYRMTDDNRTWKIKDIYLGLADGSLDEALQGKKAELTARHSQGGYLNLQIRRGIAAAPVVSKDPTLPDLQRRPRKSTTTRRKPRPRKKS